MSGEFDLLARLAQGEREFSEPTCSRASCQEPATVRIEWRNPRIHSPERIKIWLACDEHRSYLEGFLSARNFPLRIHAMSDAIDEEPIA